MKKILTTITFIFLSFLLLGCQETEDPKITLPNLQSLTQTQAEALFEDLDVRVTFLTIVNNELPEGSFSHYGGGLSAGSQVNPNAAITVYFVIHEAEDELLLPDLTGLTKAQATNLLLGLGLTFTFEDVINNQLPEGRFSHYGDQLSAGDEVEPGSHVTVFFIKHLIIEGVELPNLSGLTKPEVLEIVQELDIFYNFLDFPTNDVPEGEFVRYGGNFQPGMIVDEWSTLNIYFAIEDVDINENLIISKYIEGTGTNRALEITNRSQETVDLSEYQIDIYLNISTTVSNTIHLDGELLPGASLALVHPDSDPSMIALADIVTNELTFVGLDTIALTFRNGTIIDQIGIIGFAMELRNETFVRAEHITTGSTSFNIFEWDIYVRDTHHFLGTHPVSFPTTFTFGPEHLALSFDQPMGMVPVTYFYANDGDTSEFDSLDPNFEDFRGGRRVRFIGIDTPEMTPTPQPYAVEATNFLRGMLQNASEIYLMHDPVSGMQETYGRTLGLVWADGVLTNYEMIRMGFSQNTYNDDQRRLVFNGVSLHRWMQRAEQEAIRNNRGIHSGS